MYDHHDVSSRPIILINEYHNHRYPYLTMIYLWDEMVDFLLSSRCDLLNVGKGDVGMPCEDDTESAPSSSAPSRRSKSPKSKPPRHKQNKNNKDSGIEETMKEMIESITDSCAQEKSSSNQNHNYKIKTLKLGDCYKLYDKHLMHMRFLKENNFSK